MATQENTTKERDYLQLESDFNDANGTIRGISDLLLVAAAHKCLDELEEPTMYALANECWNNSREVNEIFQELLSMYLGRRKTAKMEVAHVA